MDGIASSITSPARGASLSSHHTARGIWSLGSPSTSQLSGISRRHCERLPRTQQKAFDAGSQPEQAAVGSNRRQVAASLLGALVLSASSSRRARAAPLSNGGKVALITGANTGIGKATAAGLARSGEYSKIFLAGHNPEKHAKAIQELQAMTPKSGTAFQYLPLELSSLQSVREAAAQFRSMGTPLHTLICNAAVMALPERRVTSDNYEYQMEVNYLSHFLLINLLLPELIASGTEADPARVISVSSSAHFVRSPLGFGDVQDLNLSGGEGDKYAYYPWTAYGQSKLAQVLSTYELAKRLQKRGLPVTANVLDPGFVDTELQRNLPAAAPSSVMSFIAKTPDQGAETTLTLATSKAGKESGKYWADSAAALSLGKGKSPFPLNKELAVEGTTSYDEEVWRSLWAESCRLVGLQESI